MGKYSCLFCNCVNVAPLYLLAIYIVMLWQRCQDTPWQFHRADSPGQQNTKWAFLSLKGSLKITKCLDTCISFQGDAEQGQSGDLINIKMSSYQYRKSHCGDKTILRPSYLHNGISYTDKMTSLYWIRALYFGDVHNDLVVRLPIGHQTFWTCCWPQQWCLLLSDIILDWVMDN